MMQPRWTVLGALGLASLPGLWATVIEPRLVDEREEVATIPGLPTAWVGQRLALLADLQVGAPLANIDTVGRVRGHSRGRTHHGDDHWRVGGGVR